MPTVTYSPYVRSWTVKCIRHLSFTLVLLQNKQMMDEKAQGITFLNAQLSQLPCIFQSLQSLVY